MHAGKRILSLGFTVAIALFLTACGRAALDNIPSVETGNPIQDGNGTQDDGSDGGVAQPPGSPPSPPTPTPKPPSNAMKMEPLSWEGSRAEAKSWSAYVFEVIREEAFTDLHKARDIETFCPRYDSLNEQQQINVWGALISGITKFESNYKPTSWMTETTMGKDPITGKQVKSEGLLQLSYQDTQWAPYCEFDWSKDKYLAQTDPKKTIFDPYKNLRCGILIMARQVRNKGAVVLSSGVYWAVIKSGGKYQKITQIADIVKKLSFCK